MYHIYHTIIHISYLCINRVWDSSIITAWWIWRYAANFCGITSPTKKKTYCVKSQEKTTNWSWQRSNNWKTDDFHQFTLYIWQRQSFEEMSSFSLQNFILRRKYLPDAHQNMRTTSIHLQTIKSCFRKTFFACLLKKFGIGRSILHLSVQSKMVMVNDIFNNHF